MARITSGRRRTGLDLHANDLTATQLTKEIDLEPALLLADVIETRS